MAMAASISMMGTDTRQIRLLENHTLLTLSNPVILPGFWADGPDSETPPGHWNLLANYVADNPLTVKQIGGIGPVVDDLEWDVKMYFALNAAVHEAACACWGAKRAYDGWRPLSIIRFLAGIGQSSDPAQPSYNP